MPWPITGTLDALARANEDPLSNGGMWSGSSVISPGDWRFVLASNLAQSAGASFGSTYTAQKYTRDQEGWCQIGSSVAGVDIFLRVGDPNTTGVHGYAVMFDPTNDQIAIRRWDAGAAVDILPLQSIAMTVGQTFSATAIEDVITAYVDGVAKFAVVDDRYINAGSLGFRMFAQQAPITILGGGNLGSSRFPSYSNYPKKRLRTAV
jgi:hypothetical protein